MDTEKRPGGRVCQLHSHTLRLSCLPHACEGVKSNHRGHVSELSCYRTEQGRRNAASDGNRLRTTGLLLLVEDLFDCLRSVVAQLSVHVQYPGGSLAPAWCVGPAQDVQDLA